MKKFIFISATILALGMHTPKSHAQADPDFGAAIDQLNLFQKQCMGNFPNLDLIRADAIANDWYTGPLLNGKPASWAVNEGAHNYSLMISESKSRSSKKCEVWGKASTETVVSAFNGLYKDGAYATRASGPDNTWTTPKGKITIKREKDGRTAVIITK